MTETTVKEETKTLPEIWSEWFTSVKHLCTTSWKALRNVFTSSFHLIKDPLIALVYGLWDWSKTVLTETFEVVKSFLIDLLYGLFKAIYDTLGLGFQWLIDKIKKW